MAFPLAKVLLLIALLLQAGARQTQTGSVRGQLLTSGGIPLEGVRVAVEQVDSSLGAGVLESIGLTDNEGRFLLENIAPGRYHIVFGRVSLPTYHPGVTNKTEATTIAVVGGRVTDVPQMAFRTTSIFGRVVDIKTGRGRFVQSLVLCCESDILQSARSIEARPMTTMVGEDGSFFFSAVSPGNYYFQVVEAGVVPVAQAIAVGRNSMENVEVRITSGVVVNGQILDRLKQAVGSANVTLKAHPSNPLIQARNVPFLGVSSIGIGVSSSSVGLTTMISRIAIDENPRMTTATPEGTFAFPGVLPGKYTLEMNAPGGNAFSREIEIGIHEALNITLDVPFTQLSGRIVHNDGSPLPKLSGSVRFVSMDPNSRILYAFPDDSGRFSALVASGEYRIFTDTLNVDRDIESISNGSSELKERRFTFDESRPQEIRITVTP